MTMMIMSEEGHGEERIFADTKSEVLNLKGSLNVGNGWLKKVDYHFRDSEYIPSSMLRKRVMRVMVIMKRDLQPLVMMQLNMVLFLT